MISRIAGFTLVELMVAIVITGILLALGLPAFSTYLGNVKVRSVAEGYLAGLQMARGEAVRRNAPVEFLFTGDESIAANVGTTADDTGRNWMIRANGIAPEFIEGKSGNESTSSSSSAASPVQIDNGGVASIIFNALGGTNLGTTAATFQFSNPTAGSCAPAGPIRCLNVTVSPGGQVRMCDPAVTSAEDTRRC